MLRKVLRLRARYSTQEGLTLGNLKFQSEVSRLDLRKGWWECKNPDINWESTATCRVATTDLEPAEK